MPEEGRVAVLPMRGVAERLLGGLALRGTAPTDWERGTTVGVGMAA
jgi:hypothetical protein